MANKETFRHRFFPIFRRHLFSNPPSMTAARSYLVRLLDDQRKRVQKEDIRLEPYLSKGVYTASGGIRPMPKRYPLGIVKIVLIAIPCLYLGSLVSKYAALALEKMDVFVYSDDDDGDED